MLLKMRIVFRSASGAHCGEIWEGAAMAKDTRAQILDGARLVFAQKGFHASIKDIAAAAEISTTSLIFWHFKDKESLLLAVAQEASPLSQVQDVLAHNDITGFENGPEEAIRAVVEKYFTVYSNPVNRAILFQMLAATARHSEIRTLLQEQLISVMNGQMSDIIRAGQHHRDFRLDLSPEFLGQTSLGLLFALITRWHVEGVTRWSYEEVTRQLLTLLKPIP